MVNEEARLQLITHFKYPLMKIAAIFFLALPHLALFFFLFFLILLNEIGSSVNLV